MNRTLILRVTLKATALFILLNLAFAAWMPLESLGRVTLYNWLVPGRERLPYGENLARSYNLSLTNIAAMMNSHVIARPKAPDEFRVLLIGDSAVWGWYLENKDALAAQITARQYTTSDGRRVVAYNLGYPIMSLTKDLLLLDAALQYQPDLVVWLITLESFPREKQLAHPILQNNPARVRRLIETYHLQLDPHDVHFIEPAWPGRTIVGQRRALADWLRLQLYGVSWAATGIDQFIPREIPLRQSDFDIDTHWQDFASPAPLSDDALAFDVLAAGIERAGRVPVLVVNEPIYLSAGRNSDLRYNSFYPRWAYDGYREQLRQRAQANHWNVLEAWNSIAPDEFTNTPVHLTPRGSAQLAEIIGNVMLRLANQRAP
jgi:hypothetical protein